MYSPHGPNCPYSMPKGVLEPGFARYFFDITWNGRSHDSFDQHFKWCSKKPKERHFNPFQVMFPPQMIIKIHPNSFHLILAKWKFFIPWLPICRSQVVASGEGDTGNSVQVGNRWWADLWDGGILRLMGYGKIEKSQEFLGVFVKKTSLKKLVV